VVEASREFVARLGEALASNGLQARYPLVVWRDREGFLKACACSDARSWAFIRDDLDAPDGVAPASVDGVQGPPPMAYPGDGSPESLPYPTLPAPLADGAIPPIAGAPVAPPQSAPSTPRPTTPTGPRPAPTPSKQDDTTFF